MEESALDVMAITGMPILRMIRSRALSSELSPQCGRDFRSNDSRLTDAGYQHLTAALCNQLHSPHEGGRNVLPNRSQRLDFDIENSCDLLENIDANVCTGSRLFA